MINNADFVRIISLLAKRTAEKTHAIAYGGWNPAFMGADATDDAIRFFTELSGEINYWLTIAEKPDRSWEEPLGNAPTGGPESTAEPPTDT